MIYALMKESLRRTDIVCRIGGEEFATILPNTSLENAALVAEKIRSTVASTHFVFRGHDVDSTQPGGKFTVSIGATSYVPKEDLYERQTPGTLGTTSFVTGINVMAGPEHAEKGGTTAWDDSNPEQGNDWFAKTTHIWDSRAGGQIEIATTLSKTADEALYDAKKTRNIVCSRHYSQAA
jgi:GGDEF domain-containing protein